MFCNTSLKGCGGITHYLSARDPTTVPKIMEEPKPAKRKSRNQPSHLGYTHMRGNGNHSFFFKCRHVTSPYDEELANIAGAVAVVLVKGIHVRALEPVAR